MIVVAEETEAFSLTATVTAGDTSNASSTGVATILDNDSAPSISINDQTVNEDAGTITFTVSLSNPSASAVSVDYVTTSGTATIGTDVQNDSGTLTFAVGETSKTITLSVNDDDIYEISENFTIDLSSPVNATIADNQGVGIINDEDGTTPGDKEGDQPSLSVSSANATEGEAEIFTVSLSNPSTQDVSVDLTSVTGTAIASDFDATNMQVSTDAGVTWTNATSATIVAGETSVLVRIPTIDDAIDESAENFTLTATVTAGDTTNVSSTGTAVINDNDGEPELSIDDVTVNEDAGSMTFTVTLSNASSSVVNVDYASDGTFGTATEGLDYTGVNGSLTFAVGELTQTITVPINDDFIAEGAETFDVVLSNAINATISDSTGLGIIVDEPTQGIEDTVNVSLAGDTSVLEGGIASYTITLSQTAITDMDIDVIVNHVTTDSGDLVAETMTLTIVAGTDSVSFTVDNNDDAYAEGDETYSVTLSGLTTGGGFEAVNVDTAPVNTVISDNTTPNTETDDEVINITLDGDISVNEGGTATYTINLDQPTATAMDVEVQTGHTTTDDGDLIPTLMVVTVPANADSVSFSVDNNQDTISEGNEDYTVALTGTTTGGGFETINVDSTPVSTTIIDDDQLAISINDVTVNEDAGIMTFTVSLSTTTTDDVTFDFASADNGSALAGSDYEAITGSGTITAGSTTTTITVNITDDYIAENPETFEINLENIVPANVVVVDAQGIGTITDEAIPGAEDTVTVSIAGDSDVNEGNSATYTVSADKAVQEDMSVDVTYSFISASTGDVVTNTVQVIIACRFNYSDCL
ncbi:Calx-beta domain-containing protein [Psychromonas sp. KJ10-10]|uniref:Calx-beta domain-containing protein n=1 Tax=Psychromonas sp. KJ10-10 TaxID=3391823 RepID=UPI0039B6B5E0